MRFQTGSNARYIASDECNVVEGACSRCIPLSAAKVALKTRLNRLDANNVNDVAAIEIEPDGSIFEFSPVLLERFHGNELSAT